VTERHDTIIVGGGQAGLVMSYHLRALGREHLILERQRVAERWHSERWDSLCFQFPNWSLQLPGYAYAGAQPDGFAPRAEVVQFIENYARFIDAPMRCGEEVISLRQLPTSGRFSVTTPTHTYEAAQVVVATGPYQRSLIPAYTAQVPPDILQLHASAYRQPTDLPDGAVLVVGAGSSGCQIAEELLQHGHRVFVAVGQHQRIPRHYRGRDLLAWIQSMGSFDRTVDSLPGGNIPAPILLTGAGPSHDIDLCAMAAEGAVLLGKVLGIEAGRVALDDQLQARLDAGNAAHAEFTRSVDAHIVDTDLDAIPAPTPDASHSATPVEPPRHLDLRREGIKTILWCSGYGLDFSWVHIPGFQRHGRPRQQRGVTDCAGLYFLGLQWMHKFTSSTLFGVGEDAAYLAAQIDRRRSG
jgi:putative flavoprotein involved in K+ transport